jgi:hypothetical protein
MDREKCRVVKNDIDAALETICLKHGLHYDKFNRVTYGTDMMRFKVELKEEDKSNLLTSALTTTLEINVGNKFNFHGKPYTVTGLNFRRPKFPVSAERFDGKKFKFPMATVQRNLVK